MPLDEFPKQIQNQLDAKANLLKKSNLASSPDKISQTSKKRTPDQLPNIKDEVIVST